MILLLVPLLLGLFSSCSIGAEILLHPKSRLAAVGVEVAFHCNIKNSDEPYWVVNNQAALYPFQRDRLAAQGFFLEERHEGGIAMLTMKVNATADKNETKLYCISLPWPGVSSHNATLLIIEDPPVSPNPSIANPTADSITLTWSPPFLWPGVPIKYYVVEITNTRGESTHHPVNTTFSDAALSFTVFADDDEMTDFEACDSLYMTISAVGSDQKNLPTFTVSGGYIPLNTTISLEVNITVLFDVTLLPHVMVGIEVLPMICDHQELSFTIFVANDSYNITQLGPYHHRGPDPISLTISSGLNIGNEYILWASVELITGTVTSHEQTFDTKFKCSDDQKGPQSVIVYGVIIFVVGLIGMLILMMIVLLISYANRWNSKFNSEQEFSERPSMVDNPIYESADRYQNLARRLHPQTLNTMQQSSIYSEVADKGRVAGGEQHQKCASESAGNVSVGGEEKVRGSDFY